MATYLIDPLAQYYLSSGVPDINVHTTETYVTVNLADHEGTPLLSERYYPYLLTATVRDLRSVIEQYMVSEQFPTCRFTLTVSDPAGVTVENSFTVLYCPRRIPVRFELLATQFFLTPWRVRRLHMASDLTLYFLLRADESGEMRISATVTRADGQVQTVRYTRQIAATTTDYALRSVSFSPRTVLAEVTEQVGEAVTLRSVTVDMGLRSLTYYIEQKTPALTLRFRNSFNVMETLPIFAAVTAKTDHSAESGICGDTFCQYDVQTEKTWEVEISNLTPGDAALLEDLLVSPYIEVPVADLTHAPGRYLENTRVYITDSTLEPKRGTDELATAKFTLRLGNERLPGHFGSLQRVHTAPFANPFS